MLIKNGSIQKQLFTTDMHQFEGISLNAILELLPNDKVWVETKDQEYNKISFTGFLLMADEN
jgi:hypothetical protein